MSVKTACIIGAGPAGLTAAMELQARTGVKPLIFEMTGDIGGLSKTVNYKGNRIDIGGHRFFSKSDQVVNMWLDLLPQENRQATNPDVTDRVMLVRQRLSRILFLRKLFDYPLTLSSGTLKKLGTVKTAQIGVSYLKSQLVSVKPEVTLEDFFINRFGKKLYTMFFRDYTKKVWGVSCQEIPKEWGAQRVKGLSVAAVMRHAITRHLSKDSLSQKHVETSLIERFFYPKYGPGYYWEQAAEHIKEQGGEILPHHQVVGIEIKENNVCGIRALNKKTGKTALFHTDVVFSSMPVRDLIEAMGNNASQMVRKVASSLVYRDFITVGVLVPKNKCLRQLPDNWIYIQENDVKLGRIQIFNNWSPYMVSNPEYLWLGLEYFCTEGDELWRQSDQELVNFAADELAKIGFIARGEDVADSTVVRMDKAYPAYFGGYGNFHIIREFTDRIGNLYLIGRNGMHRYNNMDHSMLTAMAAVKTWSAGSTRKNRIWEVNAEEEYHEER